MLQRRLWREISFELGERARQCAPHVGNRAACSLRHRPPRVVVVEQFERGCGKAVATRLFQFITLGSTILGAGHYPSGKIFYIVSPPTMMSKQDITSVN
jgi:hypothetical protein